jgi:hypothetical protein
VRPLSRRTNCAHLHLRPCPPSRLTQPHRAHTVKFHLQHSHALHCAGVCTPTPASHTPRPPLCFPCCLAAAPTLAQTPAPADFSALIDALDEYDAADYDTTVDIDESFESNSPLVNGQLFGDGDHKTFVREPQHFVPTPARAHLQNLMKRSYTRSHV